MADTLKYKDENGTVKTVNFDTTYPIRASLSSATTEWKTETVDPIHGTLQTDWVGNIPKPKA